jgi:nitroimidazol reductase NimA-like FMN-containing flavoprotein (pyridoxamine 5'-phosphate oxidase superfamily)
MTDGTARDWEDVRGYRLDPADETDLLARQTECTLIWSNRTGHPVGVVMNFIFRDGSFWLTASRARKRIAAIERDPRVSVAISSKGSGIAVSRSLTYVGRCRLHDDAGTKAWFYPEFAAALRPGAPERAAAFRRQLDSPERVVLEVVPERRIGFDAARMWQASPALAAPAPAAAPTAE